jgi:hypothetical protein
MKRLLLAPLLVLLLVSCKKNDDVIVATVDGPQLARIRAADGTVQTEFTYDDLGRLVNQKSFSSLRKTPDEIRYAYDGQGRLEKIETSTLGHLSCAACEGPAMKFTQTFEYDGSGRLARTKNVNEAGFVASEWSYEHDANGRIVRQSSFFTSTNQKGRYDTFTYDARGNITKTETFSADGTLTNRYTYQYDDRPNPFRGVYLGIQAAIFRSANNIVREKYEYFGILPANLLPPDYDHATRFTYDPATGYPVRAEYSTGSVSLFEYR